MRGVNGKIEQKIQGMLREKRGRIMQNSRDTVI